MAEFNILEHLDKLKPDGGKNVRDGDHSYLCPVCEASNFKVNHSNGKWTSFGCNCAIDEPGKQRIRNTLSPIQKHSIDQNEKLCKTNSKTTYTYHDLHGNPIHNVYRQEKIGQKKEFRQGIHPDRSDIRTVKESASQALPYRLHEASMMVDSRDTLIFWVEGEKAADAMWSIGLPAITTVGGSNRYSTKRDAGHFPGNRLILVPDLDVPGFNYALKILKDHPGAQLLLPYYDKTEYHKNYPKSHGRDIADWIVDGASAYQIKSGIGLIPDKLTAEEFLARHCGVAEHTAQPNNIYDILNAYLEALIHDDLESRLCLQQQLSTKGLRGTELAAEVLNTIKTRYQKSDSRRKTSCCAIDLKSIQPTAYLIDGLVAKATVNMTDGPSGSGKTSYEIEKCMAIIEGRPCFDRSQAPVQGSVLYIATDSGASDFLSTLTSCGYVDHAAFDSDSQHRFYVWADDITNNVEAWTATPKNLIQLIEFVKEHEIAYVVIDSSKAVLSRAGIDYADNRTVCNLITMMRETLCQVTGVAITFINHDGVADGAAAGAKAWTENVSMRTRLEVDVNTQGQRFTKATIRKDRVNGSNERSFSYRLTDEAGFVLAHGCEVAQTCEEELVAVLEQATRNGKDCLTRQEILELMPKGRSHKTIDNTISMIIRDQSSMVQRAGRARYKLRSFE